MPAPFCRPAQSPGAHRVRLTGRYLAMLAAALVKSKRVTGVLLALMLLFYFSQAISGAIHGTG
jgi:hypothetical protein